MATYTGLSIGNTEVKILTVQGRRLKKWGRSSIPAGIIHEGLIVQPEALGEIIDRLFKCTGIPKRNVIISVSGISFTYRLINLPRLRPAELEEAVFRAARKDIPLPLDELYLSWQALPAKTISSGEQQVFLLGVPRNMVDAVLDMLHFAGISPYLMDLRPLAVARAVSPEKAIIVNLEPDYFDIVVVADGITAVLHSLSPRSKADTIEDNVRRLNDELRKVLAFYQTSYPGAALGPETPLLIAGDLAQDGPAGSLIQAGLEYPVQPLVPQVHYPDGLPVSAYAATIGLVMKKLPPPVPVTDHHYTDINLNIFSGKRHLKRRRPVSWQSTLGSVLIVIGVVLLFLLYHGRSQLMARNADLEADLEILNQKLNGANTLAREAAILEKSIQQISARKALLQSTDASITSRRGTFSLDLERITSVLPAATSLSSVNIGDDQISLHGETEMVFNVVAYASALEGTGAFQQVRITSIGEEYVSSPDVDNSETTAPLQSVIIFSIILTR